MDYKYSVLIAVYYRDNPSWFSIALDSIINQSLLPEEIVIVEDGPISMELQKIIDEKIINHPNIRFNIVALEKNGGLGLALKTGVEHCQNELIIRMDADDVSAPDRCYRQISTLISLDVDIVGCEIIEFIDDVSNIKAIRKFPQFNKDICKFSKRRTPFPHPGVLMKKSKILEAGNYSDAYLHEDYDLFVRMLMKGSKGYNIQDSLVYMRISDDFYARRGGIKYLKTLLMFNKKMLKIGWMSFFDYCYRSLANIVSCLAPNKVRNFIYKKFLRKKK